MSVPRCGRQPRPLAVGTPAPLPAGPGAAQAAGGRVAGSPTGPAGVEPGGRVRGRAGAAGAGAGDPATPVEAQQVHCAPRCRGTGGCRGLPLSLLHQVRVGGWSPPTGCLPGSQLRLPAGLSYSCPVCPSSSLRPVRGDPTGRSPGSIQPRTWQIRRLLSPGAGSEAGWVFIKTVFPPACPPNINL